jgi:peroxiredoxin
MRAIHLVLLLGALAPRVASGQLDAAALVPQRLLQLVHTPEVQADLGLAPDRLPALESMLARVDAVWFPSRNLPSDKARATLAGLEKQVWEWAAKNLSKEQTQRLVQIERQAQGPRMMLRDDLATELALTPEQIEGFVSRARTAEAAREEYAAASKQGKATEAQRARATETAKAEQQALATALTPNQHEALWKVLGKPFETGSLERIYPLAPEIVPVDTWINSEPLTLRELRGKVVVVHFYAFECHNCHANFAIYRRWHDTLAKKGVVLVGIQTPETARERDPERVRAAATENKLEFPILLDIDGKNWAAWGNTMWPSVYVVDKNGYLRAWWTGELQWQGAKGDLFIEKAIDAALTEKGRAAKL